MFELKISFATAAALAEAVAKLAGTVPAATEAAAPAKPDPKPKAEKTAEKTAEKPAAPAPAPAADTKPSADTAQTAVPYEKTGLPEKIAACVKKDRDGVVALLAEFGAKKGSELKAEQYAAFGEKIDALLAAGDLA